MDRILHFPRDHPDAEKWCIYSHPESTTMGLSVYTVGISKLLSHFTSFFLKAVNLWVRI